MASLEAIRSIIRDELLQVIATGFVALSLLGVQAGIDGYLSKILAGTNETTYTSMMDAANAKLLALSGESSNIIRDFGGKSIRLGEQASKGIFCSFLGVGFSLINCSPFNAYRGSLTLGTIATSTALADSTAQQIILSLARSFAFSLLIPVGLFLRCFKVSRQAGGALIAIGFGFYAVYPTVIVATDNMLHGMPPPSISQPRLPDPPDCDPNEPDVSESIKPFKNYGEQLTEFDRAWQLAYFVLVRVLFNSILCLVITLGFIRAFAQLIGSEIDVSSLVRIS